jgi:uncharacterized membrane protein
MINLLLIIITFATTIIPLFQKQLLEIYNQVEFMLSMHVAWSLVFLLWYLYLYLFTDQKTLKNIVKKTNNLDFKNILSMVTIPVIGIISAVSYYTLLQKYELSYILPVMKALSNLLILAVGYYFLNEKITIKKILGCLLIISGIYVINL